MILQKLSAVLQWRTVPIAIFGKHCVIKVGQKIFVPIPCPDYLLRIIVNQGFTPHNQLPHSHISICTARQAYVENKIAKAGFTKMEVVDDLANGHQNCGPVATMSLNAILS